jgi:biopolymer transport protein ExbD
VTLNLAPMVDVMMCLLIFFLLATQMVTQENSPVDLPMAVAAEEVEKSQLGSRFVINIRHSVDGDRSDGARYVIRDESMTLDEVNEHLRIEGSLNPQVNCVIRADQSLPYQYVEQVMIGCASAGIRKITFSAIRGSGGT